MALELDGIAVLGGIAKHPDAFPDVAADARKAARTLVVKQLKAKRTDLNLLREIYRALHSEFSLLVDGMSDSEIKSLGTKFDKFYPELGTTTPNWRRQHLVALAAGRIDPAPKPKTAARSQAPKVKSAPKVPTLERLSSKAAAAVRKTHR